MRRGTCSTIVRATGVPVTHVILVSGTALLRPAHPFFATYPSLQTLILLTFRIASKAHWYRLPSGGNEWVLAAVLSQTSE